MTHWLRRLRGAIGIGITWGLAWFGAGMALLFVVGFGAADVPFPLFFGLLGFLTGMTFAGVLGLMARRRRFDQMSLPKFAGWGAFSGLAFSTAVALATGEGANLATLGPVFAAAGAISAAGTLALARRGERQLLENVNAPLGDDRKIRPGREHESD